MQDVSLHVDAVLLERFPFVALAGRLEGLLQGMDRRNIPDHNSSMVISTITSHRMRPLRYTHPQKIRDIMEMAAPTKVTLVVSKVELNSNILREHTSRNVVVTLSTLLPLALPLGRKVTLSSDDAHQQRFVQRWAGFSYGMIFSRTAACQSAQAAVTEE